MTEVAATQGAARWWRDYRSMLRWHATGLRIWLAMIVLVQTLAGAGFVLGISLFFEHIPTPAALFVSTGVPVINLLLVGMILGPQLVAEQKIAGGYEYVRTMPIWRSVSSAAWATVCLVSGIPAMAISLLVAILRYDIRLDVSPTVVPAVVLTSVTGTMLGDAMAHAISQPTVTRLVTQLVVFVVFGYAPILFPIWQMPAWLRTVNGWFPFRHMATLMRHSLAGLEDGSLRTAYLVLGAWAIAACALAIHSLGRQR